VGKTRGHDLRPGQLNRVDPADPGQLAALLARHRLRARHRLGQNFLIEKELRDRVVEAAGIEADDEVLEIGAGLGTLTLSLADRCRRLLAVELDERLAAILGALTRDRANVELLVADALTLDLPGLFPDGGEVVVGNIPYYLTGALLRKLLQTEPRPRRLSLVVQKEVAERLTASSGWSLATVAVRVFAEPQLVLVLPATAFQPVPKVDSALIRLEVRAEPAVEVDDLDAFFQFVERVFQFRRKQLRSSLARITGGTPSTTAGRLGSAGIDPARRPETLNLEEWQTVYESFNA
jgi:16S rRNA (adenine1518-N6/adenine1519-N6)-dimethyltransferase